MVAAFVDTLGNFLVLALLPFYAQRLGATPVGVGALVASAALAQMLTSPLWGRFSDRSGRRPVILLGLLVSAVSYLAFALADSLWLLLLSRLAQGVGSGTVSVVFAYISDASRPEDRAQGIGWLTSATSLAAMIGPAIGSWAGGLDARAPGLLTCALCAAALLVVWRYLPETAAAPSYADGPGTPLLAALGQVLLRPLLPVNGLIWIYALAMLALSAQTAVVALYLERRFGVDERTIWIFFAYLGGLSILMRLFVLGPAVRRFGELRLVRAGAACFGVGLLALPLPDRPAGLAMVVLLLPVGTALLFPCATALISHHAPHGGELGQLLGVQQAFAGLSRVVGPLAAGAAFAALGEGSPFWLAGGVMVLVTLLAARLLDAERRSAEPFG